MDFAYPRPQLRRSQWTSLNGAWRFRYDDDREFSLPSDITEWPMQIVVPFPPESNASGIGDRGFHRACWYERDFDLSLAERARDPALRRGRLLRACVGQWSSGDDARGRSHAVLGRHHRLARREVGKADRDGVCRRRPAGFERSRAASRIGSSSRIRSGTRAPRVSGRRYGSSEWRGPMSRRFAGRLTSNRMRCNSRRA